TRFVLDGNRTYAELGFVRPDGTVHRALAFVDMGSQRMAVRESLFKDLQLDRRETFTFIVGSFPVDVRSAEIERRPRGPSSIGSDLKVEAMLPASILQRYQVVIDYHERALVLAAPGALQAQGTAVPFSINPATGLIAVDASIAGTSYPIAIDNGSAYTWVSQRVATRWIAAHPDWKRGVGAVGASNMMMSGDTTETAGMLLRTPDVAIGTVSLREVGMLAAGPTRLIPGYTDFFDWYSEKSPARVIGWLGGNVLRHFRITLDYPNHTMYWLKQEGPD